MRGLQAYCVEAADELRMAKLIRRIANKRRFIRHLVEQGHRLYAHLISLESHAPERRFDHRRRRIEDNRKTIYTIVLTGPSFDSNYFYAVDCAVKRATEHANWRVIKQASVDGHGDKPMVCVIDYYWIAEHSRQISGQGGFGVDRPIIVKRAQPRH